MRGSSHVVVIPIQRGMKTLFMARFTRRQGPPIKLQGNSLDGKWPTFQLPRCTISNHQHAHTHTHTHTHTYTHTETQTHQYQFFGRTNRWVEREGELSYGSGRFFPSSHFCIRSRS